MVDQIEKNGNVVKIIDDIDQVLSPTELVTELKEFIKGSQIVKIGGSFHLKLTTENGINHLFLVKNISYLGKPHLKYKKRIQIPNYFKDVFNDRTYEGYKVHYLGFYKFNSTKVIVEFDVENLKMNKANNSSAHVYSFDIAKAVEEGFSFKYDANNNLVQCFDANQYYNNLIQPQTDFRNDFIVDQNDEFSCLGIFSKRMFDLGEIKAIDAIMEMHRNGYRNWRQSEWAGFYLEYKFEEFISNCKCSFKKISVKSKSAGLDFDLWNTVKKYYGDLKASSSSYNDTLLNDKKSIKKAVELHSKLIYVVLEHNTILDRDFSENSIMTREVNSYKSEFNASKSLLSYHKRMKYSVKFVKMNIYEINKFNVDLLPNFNQGSQTDGSPRNPKLKLVKKHFKDFVVYNKISKE